ncbi:MAG: hypothetical protein JW963_22915 [Anaerolineales bacterium]|nr:hypothetical protein [Anaerolineales bacterium]
MSKTWKWILGIVLGLVILVGVGYLTATFFGYGPMSYWGRPAVYGHPMMDDYGFGNRTPMDDFRNFRHPMMGGRGFYPFGGFFLLGGLLRLVFPLGVLALVAYFSYQAGKKAGMNSVLAMPAPEPVMDVEPEKPKNQRGRKVA